MKNTHKLALLPLLVCSLCAQAKPLDLIVKAPDDSHEDLFRRPAYHLPKVQQQSKEQIARLQANAEFAKDVYNPTIELSALQKLALVKGSSSREYLIEFIRYKVKLGGKNREEAKEAVDKLCAMEQLSYECVQGTALYEMSSPQMKLKLQTFSMHEDHRNYLDAVQYLYNLMGVPVEHELRYRYYMMLGNVEGSENEAVRGLEGIVAEIPRETQLKMAARKAIIRFKANSVAARGLKNIDNPSLVHKSQKAIEEALKIDPDNPDADYWAEILAYSRYYGYIEAGDSRLMQNRPDESVAYYKKAAGLNVKSPYAFVGLARAFALLDNLTMFEHYRQKALEYAKYESASEQQRIAASLRALEAEIIARKGEKLESEGRTEEAIAVYRQALKLDSKNPWLAYRLSSAYAGLGRHDEALAAYDILDRSARRGPGYTHAYALTLARAGRIQEAYDMLKAYARVKDEGIENTLSRLKDEIAIQKASVLQEKGEFREAADILLSINTPYAKALLGEVYESLGNKDLAVESYRRSLELDSEQAYVKLRLAALYHELGNDDDAYSLASSFKESLQPLSVSNRRALGQLLSDLGHDDEALEIYSATPYERDASESKMQDKSADSEDNSITQRVAMTADEDDYARAWILRNMNELLKKKGGHDREIDANSRRALALLDARADGYADNGDFTRALRTKDEEDPDWLRQNIVARADREYNRQNFILSGGVSYTRDSGHGGYSDNRNLISILKLTFPLFDGSATVQTDTTHLNAGSLGGGPYDDIFGTCYVSGCDDTSKRSRTGTTVALGFDNDHLHADIGTAPKISGNSLKHTDIVGGLAWDFDLGKWTVTPALYRRVVNNSLVSYYGDTDPKTGIMWGAVKKNGLRVSASYYIDEDQGFWSSSQIEYLKGKRVKNNSRFSTIGGYYYHLVNRPNERLTISPSLMYMHYQNNLGEYTYGQGGYYSPQQYLGASLALRYMRRHNNVSYMIEPVISISYANKKSQSRYPIGSPVYIADINDSTGQDSSFTLGGGIRGAVEVRVGPHLVLGTELSAVKSEDYHPVTGTVYFRYYFRDWEGDLFMPPHGPTPYAEW